MRNLVHNKKLYKIILGNHIRHKRNERGWTQAELAEEIDMDTKHLGKIEQGNREPRAFSLAKIEHALQLDKNAIFEEYLTELENEKDDP